MTTPNQFLNAVALGDGDAARDSFEACLQDRLMDALEVRKVELASGIFEVQEEETLDELSKRRLGLYAAKASGEIMGRAASIGYEAGKHEGKTGKEMSPEKMKKKLGDKYTHKLSRRIKGIQTAISKLAEETLEEGGILFPKASGAKKVVRSLKDAGVPHEHEVRDDGTASVRWKIAHQRKAKKALGWFYDKQKTIQQKHLDAMKEETLEEGGPTRKHFQQVADLIKNVEHPDKRKELAQHHAGIFKQQNPRFDRAKFMSAAGVTESVDEAAQAAEKAAQPSARNVITNIRRGIAALKLKGVNPAVASRAHADYSRLVAKNPKAPGYMLLRKLSPNKAQAMQALTQSGMPVGGALDADPMQYNQALQRVKRFN